MAKRQYPDDIIISKLIKVDGVHKQWKVVMIEKNIEYKQAGRIAKILQRVMPSGYYASSLGPGQYEVGSTYWSK